MPNKTVVTPSETARSIALTASSGIGIEADDQHHAQRQQPDGDESQNAAASGLRPDAPELIQRALHLREHGGCAEHERADAEQRGQDARLVQARSPHRLLHRGCSLGPTRSAIIAEI